MFRPTRLWKNSKPLSCFLFTRNTNALDIHTSVWTNNNVPQTLLAVDQWQNISPVRHTNLKSRFFHQTCFCLNNDNPEKKDQDEVKKPKKAGQLAKVFAEYGTTAVVFHTSISLTSLGICYMAVSSGVDVVGLLQKINLISEATAESKLASGTGTFVVAYACHKVFMPLRAFITVSCTPIIVKKLRKLGFLKVTKPKQ